MDRTLNRRNLMTNLPMQPDKAADFRERVQLNQQKLASELKAHYDFIVCGAGTSGSVVAARLAADPEITVLVLEAGGTDETDLVSNPNNWPNALGTDLHWNFVAEPNPHLNGRAIPYSMGKVLGGGSSVNVSTWSRGHKADWNFYAAEAGDPAWSYEAILYLYRSRIEAWTGNPDPEHRGADGAVHLQPGANPSQFSLAYLEAGESAGLTRFPSVNGLMMEQEGGCALIDETVHDGARQSIYRSYLYPLMTQPNVTVLTGALAMRICFDHRRATGIEFEYQGRVVRAEAAREVILSLGAIHTPKLLMQSGIGDETELKRFGIPVLQALPGVGRTLHDHVAFGCVWENIDSTLPLFSRGHAVCFWKSTDSLDAPNFYAYGSHIPVITPQNAERFKLPASSWSLFVGMRPHSRGKISITGPNPEDPVKIDANYLGDPRDMKDLIAGLRMAREIGNSAALQPFRGREVAPGALEAPQLEQFFRDGLVTFWHQCGTARMGRDEMSVVDGQLRVYGVEDLRIADGSILPRVTTGNTMAPCVVIGEQAAAFLKQAAHTQLGLDREVGIAL
jgi:choline dehydrogenase